MLRRRAAMARAILPRASRRERWFLHGVRASGPTVHGRAPPLDDDNHEDDIDEDVTGIGSEGVDGSFFEGATLG